MGHLNQDMEESEMNMADLEREMLADEARIVANNPNLDDEHFMEWSSGEIQPHSSETVLYLPENQVYIAILTSEILSDGA